MPINVKDMAGMVQFAVQLAPSSLWGEALHLSGLFGYLVQALEAEKV